MADRLTASGQRTDAQLVALKALQRSAEPLTASQLARLLTGPYRQGAAELTSLLEDEVAAGRLHRFAPYGGKQPRYHPEGVEPYACRVMLQLLAERPHTVTDLQKRVSRRLSDCPPGRRKQLLDVLVARGELLRLPKLPNSRTQRFSVRPPDPAEYLSSFARRFVKQVEKQAAILEDTGVPPEATLEAARRLLADAWAERGAEAPESKPPDAEAVGAPEHGERVDPASIAEPPAAIILARLSQLRGDPRVGPLVPVRELRRSLEGEPLDKPRFDAAMLQLARGGRIALYQHDYPASLSEEERGDMVRDNAGNIYNAVSLRDGSPPDGQDSPDSQDSQPT